MKQIFMIAAIAAITCVSAVSHAACNCDDWVQREGYCVDYVKTRIPAFPIPRSTAEIEVLKNREIGDVTEGDVAIFDLGRYWHVAYVEKVYLDQQGNALAIDLSEMNFGGQPSPDEFRERWSLKDESEWQRAVCCGVTDKYDQTGTRKNVALDTVSQIWSPDNIAPEKPRWKRSKAVIGKVREALNRLILFTGREI